MDEKTKTSGEEPDSLSWEVNGLNSLDLWDYTMELECLQGPEDLQLAAELGKTLLERNKELETALKHHQNVIEDQTQEIEYLTKQTAALREVNDSRLRIYEQLEVSIQDLERANHRLALDHSSDKKHIKSLTATVEALETKNEELQKTGDELLKQLDIYKRREERQLESQEKRPRESDVKPEERTDAPRAPERKRLQREPDGEREEEISRINEQLSESRLQRIKEERRIAELEEQLAGAVEENNKLQDKIKESNRSEETVKSMHEEFSILEEVRQGQLCGRCLRNIDQGTEDMSSMIDAEEDDDRSVISSMANEPHSIGPHKMIHVQGQSGAIKLWPNAGNALDNPYRDLVEKYEALLEVQRSQTVGDKNKKQANAGAASLTDSAPLSLQEELQMSGDFARFGVKDADEESGHGDDIDRSKAASKTVVGGRKNFTRTPDFSEAETSSSGFSDETSNKATQTDGERPGPLLCTIADGEDYKVSLYGDGSQIESHFRNRPEYREVFKEIFVILKKAAENKDEGGKLPLLDDEREAPKPSPNAPVAEDLTDETQSVASSAASEQSVPMSDATPPEKDRESAKCVSRELKKSLLKIREADAAAAEPEGSSEPQRVLTPLIRQPLEFMSASPQFRRKSGRRNRRQSQERQGAESPVVPTPPKIVYQRGSGSKRRRDYRPIEPSPLAKSANPPPPEWNGNSMQFYNRSLNSPTPSQNGKIVSYQRWNPETDSWDARQSMASRELHKLKNLELTYAEVLRNADKTKGRRRRHQ